MKKTDAEKTAADFKIGDYCERTAWITQENAVLYAQITGDQNPIHFETPEAYQSRYKRPIAHGMILAGLISGVIGMDLPGVGCIYASQSLKFLKPVYYGDKITASVEIIDIDADRNRITLRTDCRNADNKLVLTGEAVVLPGKAE